MVNNTRMSEAQADLIGLRTIPAGINSADRITRLADYAMGAPESRKSVMAMLEKCEQCSGDLRTASAAHRAISAILAVSMLETLQGI
jgi:hypothetical protein